MAVVIETTLGDITVDLFLSERPRACLNFLKLCKLKYYNFNLFHTISRSFIAQTGDPTGSRSGGESVFGILDGPSKRFFEGENEPRIKHTKMGLISFVGNEERMIGSQFFLTLGEDLTYLDEKHCVFGEVVEGFDILEMVNEVICDKDDRPYQDVRITHTVILDDPYPDPKRLVVPSRSPSPSTERLQGGRIAPDEEIDEMEGKAPAEIAEIQAAKEAKARATILEMVGDLPDADMAPPENVLFVCKLNPVTSDDDLEIIFSRFGKIKSCEVIRDKKTGDSLQYAFVEFEEQKSCENAYFKMDNVLIDDRRIHVDFSQSVSKVKWHGKGRGVTHYDERGKKSKDNNSDIGKGNYKSRGRDANYKKESSRENKRSPKQKDRSRSPKNRDNSKRIKDNSASPSRVHSKSRHERDKLFNTKEFVSPERSRVRSDNRESHKNRGRNGDSSRKNNSASPKSKMSSRSPTPRQKRYISKSPKRSRERSRSPSNKSQDGRKKSRTPKKSRGMSPLPSDRSGSRNYRETARKRRDSRSRTPNRNNYDTSKYNKTASSSSRIRHYTPERKNVPEKSERSPSKEKSRTKLKSKKSEIEHRKKEKTKKKKPKYSSEDSDNDSDKKPRKVKKSSSSSSDSEDQKKKSKKKKHGKERRDSTSDSEESVNYKKTKSKKKKRKPDSD